MTDFILPNGKAVHLIGDPHMGKRFEAGVPVHRKGEQETRQFAQFVSELEVECDICVMVGDLFDNPYVSQSVIVSTAMAVAHAAERNSNRLYIFIAGNHDVPRNLGVVGAWTTFTRIIEERGSNLIALRKAAVIEAIGFFPWEWGVSAVDQIDRLEDVKIQAAVGHWDLKSFGGDNSHLCPARHIDSLCGKIPIYSGHYHTPGDYNIDGVEVICTGSMLPYSHGEDPEGRFYMTLTKAEVLERADDLRDKFVRVILEPGEEKPLVDCLAITTLIKPKTDENVKHTVSNEAMDWNKILRESIESLHPTVKSFIEERIGNDAGAGAAQ